MRRLRMDDKVNLTMAEGIEVTGPLTIELAWQARTKGPVVLGPMGRCVLVVRATRDAEVRLMQFNFPPGEDALDADCCLVECHWPSGAKKAEVEQVVGGKPIVMAGQNIDLGPMAGAALASMKITTPHDRWFWAGRINLPRGSCLALIAHSSRSVPVTAYLAGR